MAREIRSGGRKGRDASSGAKKGSSKKKSGWVKPDGTPLRKRKGDYFPDQEIDKRKPALRSRSTSTRKPFPSREADKGDFESRENDSRPERGTGKFAKRSENDRGPADRRSRPEQSDREDRPARTYKDRPERGDLKNDKEPRNREEHSDKNSREERPSRYGREVRPGRDKRPGREPRDDNRKPYPSRNDRNDDRAPRTVRDNDRPRFDRKENDVRPARSRRDDDRPAFKKKPFEKKRERYADRDHSKEMGNRFNNKKNEGNFKKKESFRSKVNKQTSDGPKSELVRLNKFIANAGICSRREADDLITAGVITVNGIVVTELGTKVSPTDEVKFHDQALKTEKLVYVLLNKPKDYITTTDDPEERKTVMNLVHDAGKERIFPVGRLDRNTTGLLLLTNDGELTKRLTHPSENIKKIYQVDLDRNLTQEDMLKAAEGVELEDGIANVDEIHYESPTEKNVIGVELHSGRNRIVRRIFESMDYKVRKLDRVYFAGLTKKDLPRGRWRFLTEMEINMLRMLTGTKRKHSDHLVARGMEE